jgi:hypothetical protein
MRFVSEIIVPTDPPEIQAVETVAVDSSLSIVAPVTIHSLVTIDSPSASQSDQSIW